MSTITRQRKTTVFFATVDGGTSGTTSVLTTGSPKEDALALKTHLQSTFGWRPYDIVLEMYEPGKYVVLFDTVSSQFIRACSIVGPTTDDCEKQMVHNELREFIIHRGIRELDVTEIYSHYDITTICPRAFYRCRSLTAVILRQCNCGRCRCCVMGAHR